MDDMPRISAVVPVGPTRLSVEWRGGGTSTVDLAEWLGRPNPEMEPLSDPAVFARATVGAHGSVVTWDDGEGELAIDAIHLRLIADAQFSSDAADARPAGSDRAAREMYRIRHWGHVSAAASRRFHT